MGSDRSSLFRGRSSDLFCLSFEISRPHPFLPVRLPLLRSVNIILLEVHVSAVSIECDDDFASAHIMVSNPALPGVSDVVWV